MNADRFDPDATADGTAERSAELTDEFWGERPEWTPQRPPAPPRSGLGSTIGRWWGSVLGGGVTAERAHGRSTAPSSVGPDSEDTTESRVAGQPGDADLDDWTFDPEPAPERRGGVDPLLARLGGLAVIVTLAAPVIVGFTASDDDAGATARSEPTELIAISDSALEPASTAPVADPAPSTAPAATTPPDASAPVAPETNPSPTSPPGDDAAGSAVTEPPIAASAALDASPDPEPAATAPACGNRYDVAAGDYWIRLADAADVPLSDLLAVNGASVDTVLVPGDSICLPIGATTPAPPPTSTAPATTTPASSNSSSSASSSSSSSSTRTVTTTTVAPAPTTTVPTRPSAVPTSQAVQIIRDAWPDELEERAIEIAWRESNHRSNVNNFCCYGLFQIHWNAHKSWLGTVGITSVSQLYDPVLNANAAYVLYQRSGGFGPWGG